MKSITTDRQNYNQLMKTIDIPYKNYNSQRKGQVFFATKSLSKP
jgi:hypothetical protein